MTEQMLSNGSVLAVEFPDSVEYWEFPIRVSNETRGYVNDLRNGTSLDWRSSLIRRVPREMDEEFLREV